VADIEAGNFAPMLSQILRRKIRRSSIAPTSQTTLFGDTDHPAIEELKNTKVDELSPLEALNLLARLTQMIKE